MLSGFMKCFKMVTILYCIGLFTILGCSEGSSSNNDSSNSDAPFNGYWRLNTKETTWIGATSPLSYTYTTLTINDGYFYVNYLSTNQSGDDAFDDVIEEYYSGYDDNTIGGEIEYSLSENTLTLYLPDGEIEVFNRVSYISDLTGTWTGKILGYDSTISIISNGKTFTGDTGYHGVIEKGITFENMLAFVTSEEIYCFGTTDGSTASLTCTNHNGGIRNSSDIILE